MKQEQFLNLLIRQLILIYYRLGHLPVHWKLDIVQHFYLAGQELHQKEVKAFGFAAEANYQIFSFLKAEAGYEIHHRDRGNEGWKFRHRYRVGATGSVKWQHFNFSLRERFQQTFSNGKPKYKQNRKIQGKSAAPACKQTQSVVR